MTEPRFQLYSRNYCHLCHEMAQALDQARQHHVFSYDIVDVDANPELEARFGEWVPVLMDGEQEVFHYFFDAGKLVARLQGS